MFLGTPDAYTCKPRLSTLLALLAPVLLALPAGAATPGEPAPEPRAVAAVRLDGEPPAIDGNLDEAAWQQAPAASGFVQLQPDEGSPATQPTEVRFLLGADALYVGARMAADDPATIQ